jgi:hypothetical protein
MKDGKVKLPPHSAGATSVILQNYTWNLFTKPNSYIKKQLKKYEWTKIYIHIARVHVCVCVCVCVWCVCVCVWCVCVWSVVCVWCVHVVCVCGLCMWCVCVVCVCGVCVCVVCVVFVLIDFIHSMLHYIVILHVLVILYYMLNCLLKYREVYRFYK